VPLRGRQPDRRRALPRSDRLAVDMVRVRRCRGRREHAAGEGASSRAARRA
jgi:hypothetical protein